MKKITIILALVMIASGLFADGDETKTITGLRYNPDPTNGGVGQALNMYFGLGYIGNAGYGLSLGLDYEIPVIDPNLTLGPGFRVGFSPYTYDYWNLTGWHTDNGLGVSVFGGVTAHYYFDWLIPNMPDEFDVFITSNAGVGYVTYTNSDAFTSYYGTNYYANYVFFDFGNAIGGRWNFSDNMSMYLQVGHGTSSVLFGLTFKM